MQLGKVTGFAQDKEGVWQYQGRIYVLEEDSLQNKILEEAHRSEFTLYPRINKMYQDLKRTFWWAGMKSDVVNFVNKCLICQKVKIEHQKPLGILQPLEIPEWKWESISMDFMMGLLRTSIGHNAI